MTFHSLNHNRTPFNRLYHKRNPTPKGPIQKNLQDKNRRYVIYNLEQEVNIRLEP